MATHVALLRGINLGGKNKVAMTDLRTLVAELGHTDVSTYIQSGNVLFTAGRSTDCTPQGGPHRHCPQLGHPNEAPGTLRGLI